VKTKKQILGEKGEGEALSFLIKNGYKILEKNLFLRFTEIDLIAEKDEVICFFEIKTRQNNCFGEGWESVSKRKIYKIQKASEIYTQNKFQDKDVRIGILSILYTGEKTQIEIFWYE